MQWMFVMAGLEEMILELLKLDLTPTLRGLRRIVAMS